MRVGPLRPSRIYGNFDLVTLCVSNERKYCCEVVETLNIVSFCNVKLCEVNKKLIILGLMIQLLRTSLHHVCCEAPEIFCRLRK